MIIYILNYKKLDKNINMIVNSNLKIMINVQYIIYNNIS